MIDLEEIRLDLESETELLVRRAGTATEVGMYATKQRPASIRHAYALLAEVERLRAINECNDCFMEKYHGRNQFCGQHAP